jgi:hypothetical protein
MDGKWLVFARRGTRVLGWHCTYEGKWWLGGRAAADRFDTLEAAQAAARKATAYLGEKSTVQVVFEEKQGCDTNTTSDAPATGRFPPV